MLTKHPRNILTHIPQQRTCQENKESELDERDQEGSLRDEFEFSFYCSEGCQLARSTYIQKGRKPPDPAAPGGGSLPICNLHFLE